MALIPVSAYASAASQAPAESRLTPAKAVTSALAKAESSAFKTFTSPAGKSIRMQKAASTTATHAAGGSASKSAAAATASGTTIYVAAYTFATCSNGTGAGSSADPYCSIQDAVDAAAAGDTVDVLGSTGSYSLESVTVTTSDISIVGIGDQAWDWGNGAPAFILVGVSGVTLSNLMLNGGVEIFGSSDVTLDSDYVSGGNADSATAVSIDGASSGVTVSRTYVDTSHWNPAFPAISVAAGAKDVTLASDVVAASGIVATGVDGLDVAGDTIQRGCAPAIDVEGASTGVFLEDNLLEDANPNTDYAMGGYQSQCTADNLAWAPDVVVDSASSGSTAAGYNDFYVFGADATAPYEWAGTTYPTLAAFRSGAGQGAGDADDPVEAKPVFFRPNESDNVDASLQAGSTAIGTANPIAPGELPSDYYGTSPYNCRGAVQSDVVNLAISLTGQDTSAFGVEVFVAETTTPPVSTVITWDWGDGTTTAGGGCVSTGCATGVVHTYTKLGTYTVTVTAEGSGASATNTVVVTTAGSEYSAYGPVRLLDTRHGTGAPEAKVAPNAPIVLQVASNGAIPAAATAVVLNLTVTDASGSGFIKAYGDGTAVPATSNVNYKAGQTVPNLAVVTLGADGDVDLLNGGAAAGPVDLIADVTGYFTQSAASGYTSLTPDRLVDTRYGTGAAKAQVQAGKSIAVQIAGADGGLLPADGIAAVALNLTVTNTKGSGFLTAYPDGVATPTASNVNYVKGQTVANAAVVPVAADGEIDITNSGAQAAGADVIVDVVGFYSAGGASAYLPITPVRVVDTRTQQPGPYGAIPNDAYVWVGFGLDQKGIDHPDITGFVVNTTVTDTKGSGFLTIGPDPNSYAEYLAGTYTPPVPPHTSTLNWTKSATVPNLVQAGTGENGIVDFFNLGGGGGNADLIVDAYGYYQND